MTDRLRLVNLTPHHITLQTRDGHAVEVPPSGDVARVVQRPGPLVGDLIVPVYSAPSAGAVEGLPPQYSDRVYIVSAAVAVHVSGRIDVVRPGTGPEEGAIRDEAGHIVAVTRLISSTRMSPTDWGAWCGRGTSTYGGH